MLDAVASDFAPNSALVQRAAATLAAAESDIEQLASTRPADLQHALRALVTESRRLGEPASAQPVLQPDPAIPDDVEQQARDMILAGHAPPPEWRAFVHRLDFSDTDLNDLRHFALLPALQSLDLTNTQVTDTSALRHICDLEITGLDAKPPRSRKPP